MAAATARLKKERQKTLVCSCLANHSGDSALVATFAKLDVNGDGTITAQELTQRLVSREFGICDLRKDVPRDERPALCKAIMAMADTDQDGTISLSEFLTLGKVLQEVVALRKEANRAAEAERVEKTRKQREED